MRKTLVLILIGILLIPNIGMASRAHVMEYKDLDKLMTRKELATIGVRLNELENLADFYADKKFFTDVKGWAAPYINLAYSFDIMKGTGKDKFEPDAHITYVELLTVIMRSLGYNDGIDFVKYPEDYYNKALEIGLANMYIPYDQVITRGVAYEILQKAFDLQDKPSQEESKSSKGKPDLAYDREKFYIEDLFFNTSIVGKFSGKLRGGNDFTGYKIELLSQKNELYERKTLGKDGEFTFIGFDISTLAKLAGYKYRVYDNEGRLILEDNLD